MKPKSYILGQRSAGDYRLLAEQSEPHIGQQSLAALKSLLSIVHLSDTHVCDAQSPARLTFTDRFGDPHNPLSAQIGGPVGGYRANEMLTAQVLQTMVHTINQIGKSPISDRVLDAVVITGDITDNSQSNELSWAKALLTGGKVTPNSGAAGRYEGPGGEQYSEHYWNPGGTPSGEPDDFPRSLYGHPTIPDLLYSATESFFANGLEIPHLNVHGNHDLLIQGTVVADGFPSKLATGSLRPTSFTDLEHAMAFAATWTSVGPASWPQVDILNLETTTPDEQRKPLGAKGWTESNQLGNQRYFMQIIRGVVLVSLDTVNEHGGWNGSISTSQLSWLESVLQEFGDHPTIILSHHPISAMDNTYAPEGADPRISGAELEATLLSHKSVLAWLAGHDHMNRIEKLGGDDGLWHIETGSLIDWPQQGRLVDLFEAENGEYLIVTTMLDHDSPPIATSEQLPTSEFDVSNISHLASLSRELAANNWQRRSGEDSVETLFGRAKDRNIFLPVRR